MIRGVALLLLLLLLGAAALAYEAYQVWQRPLQVAPAGYRLQVTRGDSLRSIARQLETDGVVAYPQLLLLYGRWTGIDARLKRGEYHVPAGTTATALLALLERGDVVHYQVTLPEGITAARAVALLATQDALVPELEGGLDDPRVAALIAPEQSPEGLFLPETYRFVRGDSDWQLLQRAFRDMDALLTDEWAQRAPDLPLETPYQALILASIIERETGLASERAEIAGVFIRRLQRGMRLQTDPTVIYGMGTDYNGNLRRSDLLNESNPYNTYRHRGLPPTPIALPGQAAINAALNPAAGDSLYFVARGDGSHEFNSNLEAHKRAVRKYQLSRRPDYRSAPERQ